MRRSIITLSLLAICLGSIAVPGQQDQRLHPYQYLIPEGYIGWIRIDFGVKDAPPLSIDGNYYAIRIPVEGHLQTSTQDGYGLLGDIYQYECGRRRKRLMITQSKESCRVWGNFQGTATFSGGTPYSFRYFFVGPKEEYEKHQFTGENLQNVQLEKDGYPTVGSKVTTSPCNK